MTKIVGARGGAITTLLTPKERAMASLDEPSESTMSNQPPPNPVNALVWAVLASIVSAAVVGLGVAVLMSWRSEPMTATALTKLEGRIEKVELRQEEASKIQGQQSSDIRANRGEIDGLKAVIADIKTYQYRTSEEMKKISEDLARISGWITRGQRTTPKDSND